MADTKKIKCPICNGNGYEDTSGFADFYDCDKCNGTGFVNKDEPVISELRLQQECFMWFTNTYPQLRGLFFRIKNEGINRISGAIGKATGIIPGVADSCLIIPNREACFIEFKILKGKQSAAQLGWSLKVVKNGHLYFIIKTLNAFKLLCKALDL
jgi:hypothetical protein